MIQAILRARIARTVFAATTLATLLYTIGAPGVSGG
jgi:hypothetical protein